MIPISPFGTLPASRNTIATATGSQWSYGKMLAGAIVILIGIVVGCIIGIFIGLVNGWIEIGC